VLAGVSLGKKSAAAFSFGIRQSGSLAALIIGDESGRMALAKGRVLFSGCEASSAGGRGDQGG
jgi:hypothetical protein